MMTIFKTPLALGLITLAMAQDSSLTINFFSDSNCQDVVAVNANCANFYNTCTQFPFGAAVNSYQIPTVGASCEAPPSYDAFTLSIDSGCSEVIVGSGCGNSGGTGCQQTVAPLNFGSAAYYFQCGEFFD
jgi:hypothetical protein